MAIPGTPANADHLVIGRARVALVPRQLTFALLRVRPTSLIGPLGRSLPYRCSH